MDERLEESLRLNKTINLTPENFTPKLVGLILELWNDDSIREAFERRREFPKYFVENLPYFIENIERIRQQVRLNVLFSFLLLYRVYK